MGTSGANKISCSWGYCESHDRSAPRSTIPMPTWKRVPPLPWAAAYWSATSWSRVVDMKLGSTPPRMLCAFGSQNSRGRTPTTPR